MGNKLISTVILLNSEAEANDLGSILYELQINLDILVLNRVEQVLTMMEKEQIDCFILDWEFSKSSIVDLVAEIRKNPKFRNTPVVFVADKKDDNILKQYSVLNVELLISRPFNPNEFASKLTSILNKKPIRVIPENFEVLVLDDNEDVIEIHIENLTELNHKKFQTCASIAEAKKLINEKDFDLFLLDWNLGDGTCIDLIEFIRTKKDNIRLKQALIIAVTGRDDVDDIMTLLRYDVKDYIIKPFEYSEFEEKLTYALERHTKSLIKA